MIQVMVCEGSNWLHRNGNTRPYLHVYAHSDEKDETGVIGLSGVNVEFNPGMEELLGVSDEQVTIICDYVLITSIVTETIRIYVVHSIELVRTCSTKPQGASFMGNEIGPDSNIIMIYILSFSISRDTLKQVHTFFGSYLVGMERSKGSFLYRNRCMLSHHRSTTQ